MNAIHLPEYLPYPQFQKRKIEFLHEADVARRRVPFALDTDVAPDLQGKISDMISDYASDVQDVTDLQKKVEDEVILYRKMWCWNDAPCGDVSDLPANQQTAIAYGDYDLGTHVTISGGEVLELDSHLEARYEEQFDDELPF